MMASEPVTVWVACSRGSNQLEMFASRPKMTAGSDYVGQFTHPDDLGMKDGECREYVMIQADQYRQPTADLSPVAKLIAEMAHSAGIALAQLGSPHTAETLAQLAARQVKAAITAAREIEIEAK